MDSYGYKRGAVIFLISRVGTSEPAKKFLDELRRDKVVGHMVYSSSQDLNEKREAFITGGNDSAYTALVSTVPSAFSCLVSAANCTCEKLIKLFLTALERQTEPG
jgi:hypothetical protein